MTQSRIQMIGDPAHWEQLKIVGRWTTWTIDSVDHQGDVDISCEEDGDERSLFLSQDELKEVVAFLQRQIK
jgi:hypothetical protein